MLRVLIHVTSIANPFVDAWVISLRNAGATVALMLEEGQGEKLEEHVRALPDTVQAAIVARKAGQAFDQLALEAESILGGAPDVILYWWGFHALKHRSVRQYWPEAHTSLCVDTYPNASMAATELREWSESILPALGVGSIVTTSKEMTRAVRLRYPALARRPAIDVASPFPLASHGSVTPPPLRDRMAFCFSGRSDFLLSTTRRMAKDNVAPILEGYLDAGADVYIQAPVDEERREKLTDAGYKFYDAVKRADITNGGFARLLSSFDAHLVVYATPNATLRRRVRYGLSTRFATALCSDSPIIAPKHSAFARRFFKSTGIGLCTDNAFEAIDFVSSEQFICRSKWSEQHQSWAGEVSASALLAMWRRS